MSDYRNGNYSAFYVDEPFTDDALGAYSTPDFVYYQMLCMWKGLDYDFPFIDSHMKNYNVRDGSDWESTLKPRLHERLRSSKNIVLFLSSVTRNSRALREEVDYGINTCGLPVIVVYPDFKSYRDIVNGDHLSHKVVDLWEQLPKFRDSKDAVACVHVPIAKEYIVKALADPSYTVQHMAEPGDYIA